MIKKLTKKQEALIPIIRDKWILKSITPSGNSVEQIQKNIQTLYELSNLTPVPVIVCESLKDWEIEISQFIKSVESSVRSSVRSSVWSSVESSVRSSVWSSVESSVESSVRSSVRSSVESSVESSVGSSVESSVRSSVRSSVWSSVESSVGSSVRSSVRSSVGLYYWGNSFSYFDFWKETGILTDKKLIKEVERYLDLLCDCSYGFITDKIAIVLTKPKVLVNSEWRLHSDKQMAMQWKDGTGEYFLNGVKFLEELWKEVVSGNMPFEKILAIQDIDQRTQAMRYGDVNKFIEHSKGELLNESKRGNKLYKIPKGEIFTEDAYYLIYSCPSTGKVYMSGVPKELVEQKDADNAMAWKHFMSKELYQLMGEENEG